MKDRLISAIQIVWFTLNAVARLTQGYAITTLEITTLGYIFCTLGTLYFWRFKPMNVQSPYVIKFPCTASLNSIRDTQGHNAAEPFYYTPLDFVGHDDWIAPQTWRFCISLLRKMRLLPTHKGPQPGQGLVRKIASFTCPPLTRALVVFMWVYVTTYASIFVAAWNMHFPTPVERILWRTSTLATMVMVAVASGLEACVMLIDLHKRKTRGNEGKRNKGLELDDIESNIVGKLATGHVVEIESETASPSRPPRVHPYSLPIPRHTLLVTIPLGAFYCLFRLFILFEDLFSLRQLPASAFQTVDWAQVIPHL